MHHNREPAVLQHARAISNSLREWNDLETLRLIRRHWGGIASALGKALGGQQAIELKPPLAGRIDSPLIPAEEQVRVRIHEPSNTLE
jgi:hypothetical protein